MSDEQHVTVLFDGSCPLCRREIAYYEGLKSTVPIEWLDISDTSISVPLTDVSRADALKKFHVITQNGCILEGAEAFLFVWSNFTGLSYLRVLRGVRPLVYLLEILYNIFLFFRPVLQVLAKRIIK